MKYMKKEIYKFIKNHPIVSIICSIVIPIVLLQIIYVVLVKYKITMFLEPLDESDILGFLGSILGSLIGGIITLYVLKITIENERDTKQKEQHILVQPALVYSIENQSIVHAKKNDVDIFGVAHRDFKKSIAFKLKVTNIGLGPAVFVKFDSWEVDGIKFMNGIQEGYNIIAGESIELDIRLALPSYENYDEEIGQRIDFKRYIEYSDLYRQRYCQEIDFQFYRLIYYDENENQGERQEINIFKLSEPKEVKINEGKEK